MAQLKQKNNHSKSHKLQSKIDTKVIVRTRLLQMALSLHISHSKMEKEEIKAAKQYFLLSTGVPAKKKEKDSGEDNKSEDNMMHAEGNDRSDEKGEDGRPEEIVRQSIEPPTSSDSILFCIFPVKVFESHKVISAVVSIMVNIGFGMLLNYSQNVTNTLRYGSIIEFVYAGLLLPVLPTISHYEYFNAMSLASAWKFGVLGLSIALGVLSRNLSSYSEQGSSTISWTYNKMIPFHALVFMAALILAAGSLVTDKRNHKMMITACLASVAIHIGLLYITVNPL